MRKWQVRKGLFDFPLTQAPPIRSAFSMPRGKEHPYFPNIGAHKYIQQILTDIKGAIDGNGTIVGEFNTQLISMDISSRHKINKATEI